jgi:hypothetical protein
LPLSTRHLSMPFSPFERYWTEAGYDEPDSDQRAAGP